MGLGLRLQKEKEMEALDHVVDAWQALDNRSEQIAT